LGGGGFNAVNRPGRDMKELRFVALIGMPAR
jgi:hypothetical protein